MSNTIINIIMIIMFIIKSIAERELEFVSR